MNELHAEIGRLHMELAKEKSDKSTMLKIFAETLTGECDPQRILINLTEGSVFWSAPDTRPAMPAQMNGVPVCVMAPDNGECGDVTKILAARGTFAKVAAANGDGSDCLAKSN